MLYVYKNKQTNTNLVALILKARWCSMSNRSKVHLPWISACGLAVTSIFCSFDLKTKSVHLCPQLY